MLSSRQTSDGVVSRERFGAGWTGRTAVALIGFIAFAVLLIFVDDSRWPALALFNL